MRRHRSAAAVGLERQVNSSGDMPVSPLPLQRVVVRYLTTDGTTRSPSDGAQALPRAGSAEASARTDDAVPSDPSTTRRAGCALDGHVLAEPFRNDGLHECCGRRLAIEVSDPGLRWIVGVDAQRVRALAADAEAETSVRGAATDLLLLAFRRLDQRDELLAREGAPAARRADHRLPSSAPVSPGCAWLWRRRRGLSWPNRGRVRARCGNDV